MNRESTNRALSQTSPSSRRAAKLERLEPRLFLSAAHAPSHAPDRDIVVMSQNLYFGTDIGKLAAAPSVFDVPGLVADAWADVQQTNFPARAEALADAIAAAAAPDVLALQEAALWRVQAQGDFFAGNAQPATAVAYDFVQILVDELAERGLAYAPVATFTGLDVELPDALPFGAYRDIRLTDRDVILARTDLPASELKISNAQTGQFATMLSLPVGGAGGVPVDFPRGWVSVDAKVRGKTVHIVETHTESFVDLINQAQTAELLAGPANSALPTILLGDFNTDANAGGAAYQMLVGAGFTDAWTATHPADAGLTWGHADDLRDAGSAGSAFTQRLDLVLFRGGGVDASAMTVIDTAVPPTAAGPLWASDHAGVVATIEFSPHANKKSHATTPSAARSKLFSDAMIGDRSLLATI